MLIVIMHFNVETHYTFLTSPMEASNLPVAIETEQPAELSQDKGQDTLAFPSVSSGKHHIIACDFNLGIYQNVTTKGINSWRSFLYIKEKTSVLTCTVLFCVVEIFFHLVTRWAFGPVSNTCL